jgi:Ca2+-binding EF-hand superfamily protein
MVTHIHTIRVFDKEGTGKIDADELRHIFVTLGDALTQEEVSQSNKYISSPGVSLK